LVKGWGATGPHVWDDVKKRQTDGGRGETVNALKRIQAKNSSSGKRKLRAGRDGAGQNLIPVRRGLRPGSFEKPSSVGDIKDI